MIELLVVLVLMVLMEEVVGFARLWVEMLAASNGRLRRL